MPDVFAVVVPLPPNATWNIGCEDPPPTVERAFGAYIAEFENGGRDGLMARRGKGKSGVFLHARVAGVAEEHVEVIPGDPEPTPFVFEDRGPKWSPSSSGILRVAWAGWGGELTCQVIVNDEQHAPIRLESDAAQHVRLKDFDSLAYLAHGSSGSEMVAATWEHDFRGYLMYWFNLRFGYCAVSDPEGRVRNQIDGLETDGRWRLDCLLGDESQTDFGGFWAIVIPER